MEPRLYLPLRQALGSLFSLPTVDHSQPQPSHAQAHEFLMNLQSRNVRRKILSTQQRYRDSQQKNRHQNLPDRQPESIAMGSSWLASLLLLCRDDPSGTEQLFAAQTLLQRLRRNKLEDAIDMELEQSDIDEYQALELYKEGDNSLQVFRAYLHLMEQWSPFIGTVLASANLLSNESAMTERQWKGQATLLTMAAILYMKVSQSVENDEVHSMPLLQTLAGGIATIVLRLLGEANEDNFSFVPVLTEMFSLVRRVEQSATHATPRALTYDASLQVTLAAIPESLLGNPGEQSRRGRLSLHPQALTKAYADLRQRGLNDIADHIALPQNSASPMSLWWVLRTLQYWSRYLPLSVEIWERSLPIVQEFLKSDRQEYVKSALAYLLAIWEGAACTEEEILAMIVGLTSEGQQQQGKKKQSSRSKKRHKELLNARSDENSLMEARNDLNIRGRMSCIAAANIWDNIIPHFHSAMAAASNGHDIDGEGPIGCLAAAAQACLPYLLQQSLGGNVDGAALFAALAKALQRICASENQVVRALALEPIYKTHELVLRIHHNGQGLDASLESHIVDHFYQCCMSLATSCGYPSTYFNNFSAHTDEDLEIYRNDVRDMLRSLNGSEEGGSTSNVEANRSPLLISQKIIQKVLHAILDSLSRSRTEGSLPEETAVHAFSALAKPLNHQAQSWDQVGGQNLEIALQCVQYASEGVLSAFHRQYDPRVVLPIARTLCIGLASLSPMLSSLAAVLCESNDEKCNHIQKVFQLVIQLELSSIEHFDELPSAMSTPGVDVRGAMRGPGGEDHVACVALMRLCSSSRKSDHFVAMQFAPYLSRMCDMYRKLKQLEMKRGAHLLSVQGTTPKSRRILLGVICRVEATVQGGASGVLQDIFQSAIESIISQNGRPLDASGLLSLCEASYDLSAFPSSIISNFFETASHNEDMCHKILVHASCLGYLQSTSLEASEDALVQWNRLRAALFTLVKASGTPDIPSKLSLMVIAFIKGECDAIRHQCAHGPASQSVIFEDHIVGEDGVHSGIFVHMIGSLLKSSQSPLPNCLSVLIQCSDSVLSSILDTCPDPTGFVDPRCTLAEAWFDCMTTVANMTFHRGISDASIETILVDTVCAGIQLTLYPTMGKTLEDRRKDAGMSLDGPHTLIFCDYLTAFFHLGMKCLQSLGTKLVHLIPIRDCPDRVPAGIVILAAALFRGVQGSLPPWTVESVPFVYGAFYNALNKDTELFVRILGAAMQVRAASPYGGVAQGNLLSGRYFAGVSDHFRHSFLQQVTELCQTDTPASWKKMKQVIKAACGGKKKETDFKQKPSPTR